MDPNLSIQGTPGRLSVTEPLREQMPDANERAALLIIDMRRAINSPSWGSRNNPEAERNVSSLLAHWQLGFDTIVVRDAAFTFGRMDYGGRFRSAEEVHDMSLANLEGQYARIVATAELLSAGTARDGE